MNRQKLLLGVLGLLAAAYGLKLLGGIDWGGGGPVAQRLGIGPAAQRAPLVLEVVELSLGDLEPPAGHFEAGRHPFRYQVEAPPPRRVEPPRPAPQPVRPPVVETPAAPPGPQPPSVAHLRYLGSFGREGGKIAVVVSGEEIFNVREGDSLEEVFVIREIGYESVAVGFVEFPTVQPERLAVGG